MPIRYRKVESLSVHIFVRLLESSGLGNRRPIADLPRLQKMLDNSNLIVIAEDDQTHDVVGVSRCVTDYAYCCYLSDLAVGREYQGQGIGRQLIAETRRYAGPQSICLLLSAPDAMNFYRRIGMQSPDNAFLFPRDH